MIKHIISAESAILAISIIVGVLAYSITTTAHQDFLSSVRYLCVAILFFLLVYKSFKLYINSSLPIIFIICFVVFALLISYGVMLSAINGGFKYFQESNQLAYYLAFSILCFTSITFFSEKDEIDSLKILFLFYILSTIIIFFYNGLVLTFPPHFVFSYSDNLYSQGMSKFYMVGALVSTSLAVKLRGQHITILFLCILLYLFLSFLGGARGDFILGVLVLFFYSLLNYKFYTLALFSVLLVCAMFINLEIVSDNFIMLERLARVADGDFGTRDVLFLNSLETLTENTNCILVGCGFNFFQIYLGYDFGLYPHNSIMEYIITYGLIITILIFSFAFYGFYHYLKNRVLLVPMIAAYVFILSLKSGSIFEFLNLAFIIYFLSYGILTVYTNYSRKDTL